MARGKSKPVIVDTFCGGGSSAAPCSGSRGRSKPVIVDIFCGGGSSAAPCSGSRGRSKPVIVDIFCGGGSSAAPCSGSRGRSKPVIVDIFCGCGGLSEGFKHAGFLPVLGIDIDESAVATYGRHNAGRGWVADIANVSGRDILERFRAQGYRRDGRGAAMSGF